MKLKEWHRTIILLLLLVIGLIFIAWSVRAQLNVLN